MAGSYEPPIQCNEDYPRPTQFNQQYPVVHQDYLVLKLPDCCTKTGIERFLAKWGEEWISHNLSKKKLAK